jgi:hypothetical protein
MMTMVYYCSFYLFLFGLYSSEPEFGNLLRAQELIFSLAGQYDNPI